MVYLARKRVFNWWKHNFTYLRQSSLLFSIRKFDYCVSRSSHRPRFRYDSAMFTTFPPRKEAEDWVLVPALFEGSQKNSGMIKSSVDNRHFSRILHLIFAKIYGVPISKFPWENSRHFAVHMRGKCRNFHWWRVMITSQMVEASSPRDTTKQKHYPG